MDKRKNVPRLQVSIRKLKEIPTATNPGAEGPGYYSPGQPSEAIVCMHEIGAAWKMHPAAIDWLKREKTKTKGGEMTNVRQLVVLMGPLVLSATGCSKEPLSIPEISLLIDQHGAKCVVNSNTDAIEGVIMNGSSDISAVLRICREIPILKNLSITGADLDPADYQAVGDLSELRTLSIGQGNLSDEYMGQLGRLINMEVLTFPDTKVTDRGILELATLTKLHLLGAQKTHVTGTGFGALRNTKSLELLFLDDTGLDDEGLKKVALLPGLVTLHIRNTKITDGGLLYLADLPRLTGIYAAGTAITEAGIARFDERRREIAAPTNSSGLKPVYIQLE